MVHIVLRNLEEQQMWIKIQFFSFLQCLQQNQFNNLQNYNIQYYENIQLDSLNKCTRFSNKRQKIEGTILNKMSINDYHFETNNEKKFYGSILLTPLRKPLIVKSFIRINIQLMNTSLFFFELCVKKK
ncbi:hypothetical protein pb186bvf_002528 [Paramecium bursaria]